MSPVTVRLQVPYTENEQQFLLQAVEAAVRTFRSLNGKPRIATTQPGQDKPAPSAPLSKGSCVGVACGG